MANAPAIPQKSGDVLIVGAGLAGAAAALCLQRRGYRVILLDKESSAIWKIGETLAPEANYLIKQLGLEVVLQEGAHLKCPGILSSWGNAALSRSDFIFNPNGCAWQVDRALLECACVSAAAEVGATVVRGAPVRKVRRSLNGWKIETPRGTFNTLFLIDATGRSASVMKQTGINQIPLDRLVSIYVRTCDLSSDGSDARTVIEAVPNGWWYTALTPGGQRTISFQTDVGILKNLQWYSSEWYLGALADTKHLRKVIGNKILTIGFTPILTSARSVRLAQFAGPDWMAIGDAAFARDPLSGKGMTHALASGVAAADAFSKQKISNYVEAMEASWRLYMKLRLNVYTSERRWLELPFWSSRHSFGANVKSGVRPV